MSDFKESDDDRRNAKLGGGKIVLKLAETIS